MLDNFISRRADLIIHSSLMEVLLLLLKMSWAQPRSMEKMNRYYNMDIGMHWIHYILQ